MFLLLTTLEMWRMEFGAATNKTLEQKRFIVRARMTLSQSPMVADGALKLDYFSLIFVDPEVKIDSLNSLTAAVAMCRTLHNKFEFAGIFTSKLKMCTVFLEIYCPFANCTFY